MKVPEIADGLAKLGFDKEHQNTIKHHYNITGELHEGIVVKHGRFEKGEIIFPTQDLPDGSLILPDSSAFDTLLKKLKRDEGLKSSDLTDEQIESNFKEFWSKYAKSNAGEKLVSDDLGIGLIKRSSQPELTMKPKEKANVLPLIAKIAYEFYFFISGVKFFNKENGDLRRDLLFLIRGEFRENGKLPNQMFFMREEPINEDYQKYHLIILDFHKNICVLHVSFFGHVQYLLQTNALSKDIIESLINYYKLDDLKFIELRLMLDTKELFYGFGTSKGFIFYRDK
ncbi:MAG: endonuclease [Candidatus Dadabacteria bacterium]|nr:endonuclease [Candidatus Dadabacteria bacterium]